MILVTRHIGACQICEGDFKLHNLRMVHHGYTRPGVGHIIGDCYGVDAAPYELSCEMLPPWLVQTETWLNGKRALLVKFQKHRVLSIARLEKKYDPTQYKSVTVERVYKRGETSAEDWGRVYASAQSEVEADVETGEREVERLKKRIADWKLVPVRELTEEFVSGSTPAAREAAAKAKAEREAKRDAKKAKRDAIDAKNAARAERRKTMLDEAGAAIRAAVDSGAVDARDQTLVVLRELGKKKYASLLDWGWEEGLNADEAFVKLKLAKPRPQQPGRYDYQTDLWR